MIILKLLCDCWNHAHGNNKKQAWMNFINTHCKYLDASLSTLTQFIASVPIFCLRNKTSTKRHHGFLPLCPSALFIPKLKRYFDMETVDGWCLCPSLLTSEGCVIHLPFPEHWGSLKLLPGSTQLLAFTVRLRRTVTSGAVGVPTRSTPATEELKSYKLFM